MDVGITTLRDRISEEIDTSFVHLFAVLIQVAFK
jgi:hypothetical protein